jgi:hypothetical protein
MAIVRRRLGSNKRLLTLLPTRKNVKKRKILTTSDDQEEAEKRDIAATVVSSARCHDDDTSNNSDTPKTSNTSTSPPPTRDCRFETVVTPPPPEVKRVRFALSQPQQMQYAHVVDGNYLQRHKADLWYPKTHRQEQQQQVQQIIASFKKTHPETVSKFATMYKSLVTGNDEAMWSTSPSSMTTLPLEMRGLEWGITPQLKLRRKRHFRHVLQCAEDRSLPESFQQIMRHTTSQNSSRTAVLMARWYAVQQQQPEVWRKKDEEEVVVANMTGDNGDSSTSRALRGCFAIRKKAAAGVKSTLWLPPRESLQSKRIRLWQR